MKYSQNDEETESVSKKKTKQQITEKLETIFASLLPVLGERKFNKRIKKARKVLLHNLNGTPTNISRKSLKPKVHEKKAEQ